MLLEQLLFSRTLWGDISEHERGAASVSDQVIHPFPWLVNELSAMAAQSNSANVPDFTYSLTRPLSFCLALLSLQ